jgi:hypothetical protein
MIPVLKMGKQFTAAAFYTIYFTKLYLLHGDLPMHRVYRTGHM